MNIRNSRLLALLLGAAFANGSWIAAAPAMAQERAQVPDLVVPETVTGPQKADEAVPKTVAGPQKADEAVPKTVSGVQKQQAGARRTVTGSNIARVRTESSLPLLELDRAYIDQTAAITAPELIQTVPQAQILRSPAMPPAAGRR